MHYTVRVIKYYQYTLDSVVSTRGQSDAVALASPFTLPKWTARAAVPLLAKFILSPACSDALLKMAESVSEAAAEKRRTEEKLVRGCVLHAKY